MAVLNIGRLNAGRLGATRLYTIKTCAIKLVNRLNLLLAILFAMLTPVIIILFCFAAILYNPSLYEKEFIKSNVDVKMAMDITQNLLDYFRNDYYGPAPISEFTEKENAHLMDVKVLIKNLFGFLAFALVVWVVLFAALKNKKKALFYSGILTVFIPVLFLAVILAVPFEHLFFLFHNLFFPHGNWLFPAESLMVNIFTESFFYSTAIMIFLQSLMIGLVLVIVFRHHAARSYAIKARF